MKSRLVIARFLSFRERDGSMRQIIQLVLMEWFQIVLLGGLELYLNGVLVL